MTNGKTLNDKEGQNSASHLVDKNLKTRAAVEAFGGEAWMKLEFEREYFIQRVVIYNRFYENWFTVGLCGQTIEKFKSCIDDQKNVDVSVYQRDVKQKSCGTLQPTYGLEQSDQIYTLVCDAKGDILKLTKLSGKFYIWEIVVVTGPGRFLTFCPYTSLFLTFLRILYQEAE